MERRVFDPLYNYVWTSTPGSTALSHQAFSSNGNLFTTYSDDKTMAVWAVTAVPEPETYAMFLAGLGLIGGISIRRKSKSS
jgi:hypothetical protein